MPRYITRVEAGSVGLKLCVLAPHLAPHLALNSAELSSLSSDPGPGHAYTGSPGSPGGVWMWMHAEPHTSRVDPLPSRDNQPRGARSKVTIPLAGETLKASNSCLNKPAGYTPRSRLPILSMTGLIQDDGTDRILKAVTANEHENRVCTLDSR